MDEFEISTDEWFRRQKLFQRIDRADHLRHAYHFRLYSIRWENGEKPKISIIVDFTKENIEPSSIQLSDFSLKM